MFFSTRYLLDLKVFQSGMQFPVPVFLIWKLDNIAHAFDLVRPFWKVMNQLMFIQP
jgi:hypothetical protein